MLDWMGNPKEPNAETEHGRYDIEQAGEHLFWAFADDRPIGIYKTLDEAKRRCEAVDAARKE